MTTLNIMVGEAQGSVPVTVLRVEGDIDAATYAFKHLNGSAVMVNDHTAFRVDWMPFAGLKQSGYGVGGIPHTYRDMQIEKMLVVKSANL